MSKVDLQYVHERSSRAGCDFNPLGARVGLGLVKNRIENPTRCTSRVKDWAYRVNTGASAFRHTPQSGSVFLFFLFHMCSELIAELAFWMPHLVWRIERLVADSASALSMRVPSLVINDDDRKVQFEG